MPTNCQFKAARAKGKMFGNDKKGNYGPLSLHDYSDDSDDENDFVSEQIRNQRVSGWTGLFCEACWPLAKSKLV